MFGALAFAALILAREMWSFAHKLQQKNRLRAKDRPARAPAVPVLETDLE